MRNLLYSARRIHSVLILLLALGNLTLTHAQPTLLSTVPANNATGVSPSAAVVFTFSEAMNPSLTTAMFMDASSFPPATFTTTASWSADSRKLTCTPNPAFPSNKMIVWMLDGESLAEETLDTEGGMFTTGTGGGSTGDCTNQVSSFTVAKAAFYEQTSAASPTLSADAPYAFVACSTVACSNLTTTNISLRLPTSTLTNLPGTIIPGHFSLTSIRASSAALESAYPNGDYGFNLQSSAGVLAATVNFPASLVTPNAPRLTNYAAAQTIDATKPFVLAWDAFTAGTTADWILVEIYGGVFTSGDFGVAGALNGTARGVTIPANTLKPASNYLASVTFYDMLCLTNSATKHITLVYRGASTEFTLTTLGGTPATPLVLTNALRTGNVFAFDVTSAAGKTLIVESRTNLAMGEWEILLTTNSPAGRVHITDPRAVTNRSLFYRVR